MFHRGKRLGFEFKYAEIPKLTKSMHTAVATLKLDEMTVIYPGKESFPLDTGIMAKPLPNGKAEPLLKDRCIMSKQRGFS